jgi:hypothetical protein
MRACGTEKLRRICRYKGGSNRRMEIRTQRGTSYFVLFKYYDMVGTCRTEKPRNS